MNLDPLGLRQKVLNFVADVVAVVRYDPVGEMSMTDAMNLLNGESDSPMDNITLAEAERIFNVAKTIRESHALGMSPEIGEVAGAQMVTDPSQIPAGFERLPEDHPQVQAMAKKLGVPPSMIRAYADPEEKINTVNGPVSRSEIPVGADGQPTEEWLINNCTCDEHTAMRNSRKGKDTSGPYL